MMPCRGPAAKAEVLAQVLPLIGSAEQSALLQFRYHCVDEVFQAAWEPCGDQHETIGGTRRKPSRQIVGDIAGRAADDAVAIGAASALMMSSVVPLSI
jgi:hypothetical protein